MRVTLNYTSARNDSLSDINKFNYLKRFLTGEALSSISGLALTSDNYKEAVDILKKRYGNPQVLITAYMETLLKLSKVKGKDVSGLRKLFNEVENCLRSLRSLKVETSTYGSLLLPLLKVKVPDDFLIDRFHLRHHTHSNGCRPPLRCSKQRRVASQIPVRVTGNLCCLIFNSLFSLLLAHRRLIWTNSEIR